MGAGWSGGCGCADDFDAGGIGVGADFLGGRSGRIRRGKMGNGTGMMGEMAARCLLAGSMV